VTVEKEQIRQFLRGEPIPEEVIAEIERDLENPDSLVAKESRRLAEAARRLATDENPLRTVAGIHSDIVGSIADVVRGMYDQDAESPR